MNILIKQQKNLQKVLTILLNMKTYQDWDEYDDYLQQKMDEDYKIDMALKPQRDLEEQEVMDELFPEK